MSEMVERVAKVFADAGLDGCEATDLGGSIGACVGKCLCRETARAAILAMRTPTIAMCGAQKMVKRGAADFIWCAMVDAALAE
jgi:hypothetical protein